MEGVDGVKFGVWLVVLLFGMMEVESGLVKWGRDREVLKVEMG